MAADAFADDVIAELLERTEKGEALTRICEDKRMPGRTTVYDWLESDKAFAERFQRARARGVHALVEDTLHIADEPSKDAVAAADKRIRIDTRLRLAGKWLPSVYGEKVALTGGGDGDAPIRVQRIELVGVRPSDDGEA